MENKDTKNAFVRQVAEQKYEYGFTTDVHTDIIEKGLNEDVVRLISQKKGEPEWMLGSDCGAHTFPYMDIHNDTAVVEHEATTSKISEDQLFYCNQRGIPTEQAVGLIVNGYAKEVLNKLPMEFAVEAQKLLSVSLEGTVG